MVAAMIDEEESHGSGEMTKQASVENGDGVGAPSAATPGGQETATPEASLLGKRRGRCKWFNVAKGWGFITPDDNTQDVFVHQSVIQMTGFRSLGDEEEVEFSCKPSDKGLEATQVTACGGGDCCGSHRRPVSKKRFRKIRCYNCGEFANHIAAKCTMGPQPKRCHHCKSEEHLIADCPSRPEKKKGPKGEDLDTDEELDEEEEEEEEEEVEELAAKLEGLDVKEEK